MGTSEYYFPILKRLWPSKMSLRNKIFGDCRIALNPKAVSKMGATVAIYANRKTIWIKIDSYIDERSDPLRRVQRRST
jgi:hypothetical protein